MQISQVWPSGAGLLFRLAGTGATDSAGGLVVDVDLDGRRVWSFRQDGDGIPGELFTEELRQVGEAPGSLRFQAWPPALAPRLRGRFRVRVRPSGSDDDGAEADVSLDGSAEPLRLVDFFGRPLVVNKWGRLGRAIVDAGPEMVARMLDHMDGMRSVLEKYLGPVVFVTGGTLLGPVRDGGRVLPHDDDADLAYLSHHTHPADVALESFEVGRLLRVAGYDVLRLSVGHLQVVFSHDGIPDHYVDIFPGFFLEGWWLQHFAIRARARREDLVPTSTILVEGRPEPAPAVPEVMLVANYGEGWRTPDPSFVFDLPTSTADRFYGWFADYNVEREDWDDDILLAPGDASLRDEGISAFARRVHEHTPPGTAVLDLGCGVGTDALALAELGRTVCAVDFSRYAVATARARLAGRPLDVSFEVLNLLDTREVIRFGAERAAAGRPWTVVGRRLLNALEDRGRANVFRLCSMLLRGDAAGGAVHFDVVADHAYAGLAPYRHVSVDRLVAEAADHRLVLEEAVPQLEPFRWFGTTGDQIVPTHRMTFRRRA